MLVLLPDVVFFGEVDKVDDGFCGEEEERVDYFDLGNRNGLATLQKSAAFVNLWRGEDGGIESENGSYLTTVSALFS